MREMITIGKIVNTHGVRGEVRILPLTDFPERFSQTPLDVWLPDGRQLTIVQARPYKQFVLALFDHLHTLDEVERLKGTDIQIPRQDLGALPPGHYYLFEVIGLSVYNLEGVLLGVISEVLQPGSNDVYVVDPPDGSRPLLVPAIKQVVKDIDVEHKRMVVQLLEDYDES